tara:strand:- start:7166 stop:8959 length:1794 start_codon:yes stop_codon:yes gene_type:complete
MDDFNSRVGRTVKAYQGNPKALDKKYQMNKELADLIGLQTILSQQEAISRETMLRENQQVGNLREQYEQKLASNSQDGMAKRIAGVMGAPPKQNQQPPMPQGIAGQAPPQQGQRPPMPQGQRPSMPQGQRPPMGAGIAGQPRPNMRMAAQGGIIGYLGGGTTSTDEETPLTAEELEAARIAQEASRETMQGAGGEAAARVAEAKVKRERLRAKAKADAVAKNAQFLLPGGPAGDPAVGPAGDPAGGLTPEQINAKKLLDAQKKYGKGTRTGGSTTTVKSSGVQSFLEQLEELGVDRDALNQLPERGEGTPVSDALPTGLAAIQEKNARIDPDAKKIAETKRLDDRYGIENRRIEQTGEIEAQLAQDKAQMDPDSIAKEEKNAILRGMALGGVRGSTIAQDRLKSNISKNKQANMDRIKDMTKNRHAEQLTALEKVDAKAAVVWKNYADMASKAFDSVVNLSAADLKVIEDRYRNDLAANNGQLANQIAAARAANELTLVEVQRKQVSVTALSAQMDKVQTQMTKIKEANDKKNSASISAANSIVREGVVNGKYTPKQVEDAKNTLDGFNVATTKEYEDRGLTTLMEGLVVLFEDAAS